MCVPPDAILQVTPCSFMGALLVVAGRTLSIEHWQRLKSFTLFFMIMIHPPKDNTGAAQDRDATTVS